MKLTFPHMGNTYITAKSLLDDLGVDYIIPPFNNKKALETGTKYAPELACLPLKINLGNYIEAYNMGADTILITGGCGPCRFGYYSELEKEILKDNGYDMEMLALEMPDQGPGELLKRIKQLAGGFNVIKLMRALRNAAKVSVMVDNLERLTYKTRPREVIKSSTDKIYKAFRNEVLRVKGSRDIQMLIMQYTDKLNSIELDKGANPMKIGIVGEIYTTIDSYTSFNLDIKLGNMGIEVSRAITVSEWVIDHIIKKTLHIPYDKSYADAAKPYLGTMIGGHAQETIGNTVLYAKKGYDGIIQIYPLTCMPEIVSQSILPAIERDFNIPVLSLVIDELTGEAGYLTRVEAFLDLLERRRESTSIA